MLTLSPITIIGTIINLLVLYFLLQHFLFKPIQKIMDKREEIIKGQLQDAEEQKKSAYQLRTQYEQALSQAKEESGQIVERARTEAALQADAIVQNANTEAVQIVEKARKTVELEREQAMQEMKAQVADIALAAASKIMGDKNSSEKDLALYDRFLEEAGDSDDTNS
ncbi:MULTISPECIES: F0F1 ATP synthase subunit B [Sellimonas]|uniref:ATP synthase subunit b n=1 Tax=Sellimonas caecigallum TaxID=2592333 RepID=A0ABS7L729_9FIRM|nr:F0F1 ATP synthase subunit B [Sellimonas caecigallum]MBY0758787.1 F0F1 ATP synthase subunit B [Sellimonas caecigallum]